jgi:Zn2+/Cd2+-exporting ATPase
VIPGYGVEGIIIAGNKEIKAFIGDLNRACSMLPDGQALQKEAEKLQQEGKIACALVLDSKGYLLAFSDHARPGVSRMLDALKATGRRLLMLTGDHQRSAERIAAQVGIDSFEADLKPEDKLRRIEELSTTSGLAMVGDGINDAPALARATVGICMGQVGSATARSAADIILLHDNVELLDWLFAKASKTRTIVTQNLLIASLAILAGTIPSLFGYLPLWLAVIVHEGGTVLVGLNAIRLLKK